MKQREPQEPVTLLGVMGRQMVEYHRTQRVDPRADLITLVRSEQTRDRRERMSVDTDRITTARGEKARDVTRGRSGNETRVRGEGVRRD